MQLTLDGCAISYDYKSIGDGQPPLLFLHGALGVRGQFDALRKQFPERSHLALDFPSHGESRLTGGSFHSERLANDVLALLNALQIDQVDIIGHSMGGYVGLVLAHFAPLRVRSIVTLGTKFYWTEDVIETASKGLDPALLKNQSQRFYDAMAAMHSASGADETLRLTQSLMGDFARWQLSEEMVRAAKVALLICAGDRDALVPVAEVAKLFAATDTKRNAMAIFPGTPHPLQQLPLDCVEHAIRRFWTMTGTKPT